MAEGQYKLADAQPVAGTGKYSLAQIDAPVDPQAGQYAHPGYKSPLPWVAGKMDEAVSDSVNWMAEGLRKALHGSSTADERLGGVSQVLHGFANSAGVPMLMEAGIAAPLRTALGLGTGIAAQQGTTAAARALGAGEGTSNFAGDAAGLVVGGLASRDGAPTALAGAAKGAYQAASTPMSVFRPTPVEALSTAVGGYLGKEMGIPGHVAGAAVGRMAPQIVRGAVTGARAALAERLAQSIEALKKADLERNQPVPQQPAGLLGAGPVILDPAPDGSFVRAVPGQYPAKPMPGMPAPQQLLGPGPVILDPPPDASFVRSVPAQYPGAPAAAVPAPVENVALLDDIAKGQTGKPFSKLTEAHQTLVREIARRLDQPAPIPDKPVSPPVSAPGARGSAPATPPPVESPIATAAAPAETAPQSQKANAQTPNASAAKIAQQLFEEMQKSGTAPVEAPAETAPPRDFAAEARAERAANSKTLSDALGAGIGEGKISLDDVRTMEGPHWKMLVDALRAKGMKVDVPNAKGVFEILANLRQMEVPNGNAPRVQ